jgi:thiosulfate oxidation carrier complex protein SoxZ
MSSLRIKAQADAAGATVNVLVRHPMETGRRKDESGRFVPALYIETLTCFWNDRPIMTGHCGTGIARNPFIAFRVRGARAGARLRFEWVDNTGAREQLEYTIV